MPAFEREEKINSIQTDFLSLSSLALRTCIRLTRPLFLLILKLINIDININILLILNPIPTTLFSNITFIQLMCHSGQDMEITKASPNRGLDKEDVYINTMEYYSAIRRNKIAPLVTAWMDLENVMLSEISRTEKAKSRMMSLRCGT